jgi:phosphoglucosamine mutase
MVRAGRPLSELAQGFERVPQALVNVPVASKPPLGELPGVSARIRAVEAELRGEGRVLVRYSGTENKARVMVEGPDADRTRAYADELAAALVAEIAKKKEAS